MDSKLEAIITVTRSGALLIAKAAGWDDGDFEGWRQRQAEAIEGSPEFNAQTRELGRQILDVMQMHRTWARRRNASASV